MVERQEAQRAYEDFLHRRQDPALLEKEAGNEFRARIFPIPAKGRKEILISYSQEMESASKPYALPLQGLPKLDNLTIEVRGRSGKVSQDLQREAFKPDGDFVLEQDPTLAGLIAGDFMVARVRPRISSVASPPEDLLVLVDTSASRGPGFESQVKMVGKVLAGLPNLKTVTVAAFDQDVKMVFQGPASSFSGKPLLARKALGASDLGAALDWATKQKGYTRLLLVSDGITTAGADEIGANLHNSSLKRLDVILVGGIRDKERMETLVADRLELDGGVFDGDLPGEELANKLSLTVNSGLDVSVEGAKWVWPQTLDNVQPGDDRLVYAQLEKPATSVKMSLGGDSGVEVALRKAQATPLLTRSAVVAQIARLESLRATTSDQNGKENMAKEIISLSTAHRVLSDLTALLVLESEADYERFHIDRKSLVDILEVGGDGLVLRCRTQLTLPMVEKTKPTRPHIATHPTPAASATPAASSQRLANNGLPGSSSDYIHEVEETTLLGQVRTRRADDIDSGAEFSAYSREQDGTLNESRTYLADESTMGRAEQEAAARMGGPGYNGISGLIERPPGGPAAEGVVRSTYQVRREVMNRSAASAGRSAYGGENETLPTTPPLTGKYAEIDALRKKSIDKALEKAWKWQRSEPGDVLALLALGDCLETKKDLVTAARAYGSIIDLYPSRADLRRFAGSRLERLGKAGMPLAVDTFGKAVAQRPDHVSSHRFLAMALARQGLYQMAFAALEAGLSRSYPSGRFAGYERLLQADIGIIGAAWAAREPKMASEIRQRLNKLGASLASKPSLRFVLTWETDSNDVDFHIRDAEGLHAYYADPILPSGGELFADVTTGYGPECFEILGKPPAFPYSLSIHYYARGPMGYGMGQLELLQHDGKGNLIFEERPYVIMADGAFVDLGNVPGPLK